MSRYRVGGLPVPHDWEGRVRKMPRPSEVARLIESHGAEAALERWSWINPRTLGHLAQEGKGTLKRAA